jgi:hypothetical protein
LKIIGLGRMVARQTVILTLKNEQVISPDENHIILIFLAIDGDGERLSLKALLLEKREHITLKRLPFFRG